MPEQSALGRRRHNPDRSPEGWLFIEAGRLGGLSIDMMSNIGYWIDDHKRGVFERGAPTAGVLEVTGRPAGDFESIVRRYAARPRNRRTPGDWVREFAEFMMTPLSPGFNFGATIANTVHSRRSRSPRLNRNFGGASNASQINQTARAPTASIIIIRLWQRAENGEFTFAIETVV